MNSLIEILKEEGIDTACREIGIDFDKIFRNNLTINPYQEHKWYANNHPEVIVFSAVPVEDKQDRLFWEEWFRMRDEYVSYHHTLTLWRPKTYDEIYEAPAKDDIHPEKTFSKKWYVVNDPDMTPWLLRR